MVGDVVLAALLVGGGLLMLFLRSAKRDRQDAEEKAEAARRGEAAAREEARKYRPGARLLCVGCDLRFRGPLTDAGCPQCRLLSLVVADPVTHKER